MKQSTHDTLLREASFGAVLAHRAEMEPDETVFTFLSDNGQDAEEVTYLQLHMRAQAIASALLESRKPGGHTLLLFPPGLDYVASVFGCFQAGVVGVSAPPPQPKRLHRTLPRLTAIAADAEVESVLTSAFIRDAAQQFFQNDALSRAEWIAIDALPEAAKECVVEPDLNALAFLQYTSGSTREPRGVMLSHRNLLTNSEIITRAFGHRPATEDKGVIWLPPYHDMGLIGGVLQPVHVGGPCVLMSPLAVIKRPARWLEAISRFRATTSGGPNFAYDLCVNRIDDETCETLDLSSWRVAFNGAEPIRATTIEAFSRKFERCGFKKRSFFPCYGLAEATLIVTGPDRDDEPSLLDVDARAVERGSIQPPVDGEALSRLVGCGTPYDEHELVIVDPASGSRCKEGEVGEIWVAGPSVALGYWRQSAETDDCFGGELRDDPDGVRYLRTGDLGAVLDDELYVVGRLKELLILNGRNIHPHDIEFSAEAAHPCLRPHCSAAFERGTAGSGEAAILLEIRQEENIDMEAVIGAVRQRVAEELDLSLAWIGLCGAGEIPKTTSGKIQRNLCRTMVEAAEITRLAEAPVAS
jgi:acyl-CoA synthetase (AMP-forming)/AMP-acid ligase II